MQTLVICRRIKKRQSGVLFGSSLHVTTQRLGSGHYMLDEIQERLHAKLSHELFFYMHVKGSALVMIIRTVFVSHVNILVLVGHLASHSFCVVLWFYFFFLL